MLTSLQTQSLSELLMYLANKGGDFSRIPALAELSRQLGISISCLREQLEVARSLGIVEVKPKTGIRRLPYDFHSTLRLSLAYAMSIDENAFDAFSDLRNKIETSYWYQAVSLTTSDERNLLMELVVRAEEKIHRVPPQIPHQEHREFHLLIYRRLGNPFVLGILESYWELYESVGLNTVVDVLYLEKVWSYHRRMAVAILAGNYDQGYEIMQEHLMLINQLVKPKKKQMFE